MALNIAEGIRGIIFDLDGTLVDSMPLHFQAWRQALKAHGVEYPKSLFYELAGMPTRTIVPVLNERLQCRLDPGDIVERKDRIFLSGLHTIKPIAPVLELAIRYQGVCRMAVGTGGRRSIVEKTLRAMDLEDLFDTVVTAEDVTEHKPAPDTFLLCAERLDILPESCQVFEDGDLGLEAARTAGMTATDVRPHI